MKENIINARSRIANGLETGKKEIIVNTQTGILRDFETQYGTENCFQYPGGFRDFVLRINKYEPTEQFAQQYLSDAERFLETINEVHKMPSGAVTK